MLLYHVLRKFCTFELAAKYIKMFGINDVAEALAKRKDRFVKRYASNSHVVCEICTVYCIL